MGLNNNNVMNSRRRWGIENAPSLLFRHSLWNYLVCRNDLWWFDKHGFRGDIGGFISTHKAIGSAVLFRNNMMKNISGEEPRLGSQSRFLVRVLSSGPQFRSSVQIPSSGSQISFSVQVISSGYISPSSQFRSSVQVFSSGSQFRFSVQVLTSQFRS